MRDVLTNYGGTDVLPEGKGPKDFLKRSNFHCENASILIVVFKKINQNLS
jgi:hypothetical protein